MSVIILENVNIVNLNNCTRAVKRLLTDSEWCFIDATDLLTTDYTNKGSAGFWISMQLDQVISAELMFCEHLDRSGMQACYLQPDHPELTPVGKAIKR